MSTEPKMWKDPQPIKVTFRRVVRKSKAGVEYSQYVPTMTGDAQNGVNRKGRLAQAARERSAVYKSYVAKQERLKVSRHAKVLAVSKAKAKKKE